MLLPDRAALFGWADHGVTILAAEGRLEFGHVAQRPDDPEFADRVRIGENELALGVGADFVAARLASHDSGTERR